MIPALQSSGNLDRSTAFATTSRTSPHRRLAHRGYGQTTWGCSGFSQAILSEFGNAVGLRGWRAVGMLNNQPMPEKVYALGLLKKRPDPDNDVSAWEERKFRLNACVYYPAQRHPGYGFTGASNVRSFKAEISESTVDQNRQHAFQLNLTCLIGWQRCDKFSELMPAAWADFQDDNQWFDTQQSTGLLPPQTDCQ